MTVIVAALTGDHITMAADSQISAGWQRIYTDVPKIWTAGAYLIGGSGDLRAIQVVRHHTSWPKHRPDEDTDVEAFVVKQVVPALRNANENKGVTETHHGSESWPCTLLIAWGATLVEVDGHGAVVVPTPTRHAIGSGYAEALGALGDAGPWRQGDVIEAARRSTITARGCDGPITWANTKRLKVEVER